MRSDNYMPWKQEEIESLLHNYSTSTNEELLELFPDRTLTSIYKKAYKSGLRKSKEIEFMNRSAAKKGEKSGSWKGGRKETEKGYILRLCPNHDRADKSGYVMEHILVFEEKTGVKVPKNCVIHHLNGDKADNRIENLCMMEYGAHTAYHHQGTKLSQETREKISKKARERKKC